MLVWRSCLRGRLWAALLVFMAVSRPLWAAGNLWDDLVQERRAEFRARSSRPEAIATVAALAQDEDDLPPGQLAQVLREILEGKLGGAVDPLVAAQAAYLLSLEEDQAGHFNEAGARRQALGFMAGAWVLGPFDSQGRSGLGRSYPVEEAGRAIEPRPDKVYAGKEGEISWRRAPAQSFVQGALFLDALLRPASDAVAYCLTYVHSDRDQWVGLRLGSAGPLKAWLGGEEIFSNDVVRPAWPDQDAAPIHLRRGANLLVIKSVAVRGPWRLFVRLTDVAGAPLPGVTMSAEVPEQLATNTGKASRSARVRNLGALLAGRAERTTKARAAQAWLDYALYLSLVSPVDSDLRASESAAKKAVPPAGTAISAPSIASLLLLGKVAREEDDRRAALERALPSLTSIDKRANVLAAIGRLWRSQRRDDAAVVQWRKALSLDAGCVAAHLALAGEEQRAGMAATALARLEALPEAVRKLTSVQDALADALSSLGRNRKSEAVQRAIRRVRRTDIGVLRELAIAARARGNLAQAARLYAEAVRWRPDLPGLVVDQAAMLEGNGDLAGARAALDEASQRIPGDAGLPEERGQLEARAGQIESALVNMRRSLQLRPQNPKLRRYVEALASERKTSPQAASVDDLVTRYASDGEAVAHEVLFGPAPADDASAEVLLDRTVVRVHANGLAERFVQRMFHARTDRAAKDSRVTEVRFEPGRQQVEIRKARILRRGPSGGIEISEATGRDEEDLSQPWYGLYYDTRAAIVTFENVRKGDVVEVQYTVVDVGYRNEFADYFGDLQMIADVWPTRRWDYTLIAPASRAFYFNQPRLAGIRFERQAQGTDVRYQFVAKNVPRVQSEPAMPGFAEVAPYLHVSTYRTWQEVGHWYWNLVREQMQDDGTLRAAATRAIAGAHTTLDKVKAIHRLVVQNTRYVGLEFGIHGYKPYKATQVLERRFGDCKDKATLFVTLLESVGIDAQIVLLRTRRGGRVDETPASLAVFDHAIAYVPSLDLYVDGTAEFSGLDELPAGDQDTMALRLSPDGAKLVHTPLLPAESNRALRRWKVDLRTDGSARIAEDLTITGQAAQEWRSHYQTEGERRERYAKVWSGRYAGARLESVEMEVSDRNQPVRVRSLVDIPQFGEPGEGGEINLPTSSREADMVTTYARLGQRQWPLIIGYPWHHEERVSYTLPKGARIVRIPANRNEKNQFGQFTLVTTRSGKGEISIDSEFVLDKSRIETVDYSAFRAFLRDTDAALAERVVVQLGREP